MTQSAPSLPYAVLSEGLGVKAPEISKRAARGMPTHDVEAAKEWSAKNVRKIVRRNGQPPVESAAVAAVVMVDGPVLMSYDEARRRREQAEAERAELKLAEERNALVRIDQVRAEHSRFCAQIRDTLLQMGPRLTPLLVAADGEPGRISMIIDAEVNAVLRSIAEAG